MNYSKPRVRIVGLTSVLLRGYVGWKSDSRNGSEFK